MNVYLTSHRGALPWMLTSLLLLNMMTYPVFSQAQDTLSLSAPITVINGSKKVRIDVSNQPVRNVLRALASKFNINLVLDNSVQGNVSLRLNAVSVDEALRAIADSSDLEVLPKSTNVYLVVAKEDAEKRGLTRAYSKVIPIKYASAQKVADLLNQSLFKSAPTQGGSGADASGAIASSATGRAKVDNHSNSVVIVGTNNDLKLAEALIANVDKPRKSKTFYLSNANALDLASLLAGSIFNEGNNLLRLSGGSSAGTSNQQTDGIPSSLRVEQEDIQEGSGISSLGSGGSGGGGAASGGGGASGGGASGGGSGPLSQSIMLRGMVKSTQTISVSSNGPIVIPDTRNNSITIMGTENQLAQAEKLINTLDARLPQVSIEASLVEISETGIRELGNTIGVSANGLQFGFNNQALPLNRTKAGLPADLQTNGGITGLPTILPGDSANSARSGIGYSSTPYNRSDAYLSQIRALITNSKAKLIANPSIVATHDTEAIISIVDEVVRSVVVNVNGLAGTVQNTVNIGEVGIVLDILPKIGDNRTVSLRIRPHVSTVREVTRDSLGNIITLLSKRDLLAQSVRLKDGETLLLGGLINQNDIIRKDKLPVFGDLPIVGAMFRASSNNKKRTELVMMLTPHILNPTIPTQPVVKE